MAWIWNSALLEPARIQQSCFQKIVWDLYSFMPAKFQYLEESEYWGKPKGKKKYQQLGNACQKNLFLCWWLSTDFLASTPHPTAIARKPRCQLVLMFGVSWRAKEAKQALLWLGICCVSLGLEPVYRNSKLCWGLWHTRAQGQPSAECLGTGRPLVGALTRILWFIFHSMAI